MIADDPFTREDFRDRLQEAEAEAARRKLLQHLAQHGVSLSDLTAHLGELHESGPVVSPGALREAAVRAQRAETAHRAAEEMNERLLPGGAFTAWTVAGALAAAAVLALVVVLGTQWGQNRRVATSVQQIAPRVSDAVAGQVPLPPGTAATDSGAGARRPGEWIGTILQSAELLDDPDSAAQRRAMLDTGARVLVLQSGPVWLRVRTERGDGYVLKGLVRADR